MLHRVAASNLRDSEATSPYKYPSRGEGRGTDRERNDSPRGKTNKINKLVNQSTEEQRDIKGNLSFVDVNSQTITSLTRGVGRGSVSRGKARETDWS
jgi:hypothetical protein